MRHESYANEPFRRFPLPPQTSLPFHSSSSRLRFPFGRDPGPQFGAGFCGYLTNLNFGATNSFAFGWCEKSASNLGDFACRKCAGDVGLMLSAFTGWSLTQPRNTSCTSRGVAFVFIEPAWAWDRDTANPACRSAATTDSSEGELQWNTPAMRDGVK